MFKKLTAIAILVISIPVVAYAGAWTLNTWARSAGGTITVGTGTAQSVTNGSQFTNYTGGETVSVTISPKNGYSVQYFIDQIGQTAQSKGGETPDGTAGGTITLQNVLGTLLVNGTPAANQLLEDGSVASLWAVFHATSVSVTAAGDANSSVNLTNIPFVYPGTVSTRNIVFTFTATPGYVIQSISGVSANGLNANGFTYAGLGAATAKVTIPTGYVFSSALSFTSSSVVSTTTSVPNAGAAQAVAQGATFKIKGSVIGNTTLAAGFPNWSTIAKPVGAAQPFAKFNNYSGTFKAPATNGTYVFQFRISNTSTALTSVQVSTTALVAQTQLQQGRTCQACHTANGIAINNPIYADYSASGHHAPGTAAYAPYCASCHLGTGTGGHPGTLNAGSVNSSTFVVTVGPQAASEGSAAQGAIFCTACHSGTHGIPHSVVNLTTTCAGCHTRLGTSTNGTGDAHSIQIYSNVTMVENECINCHRQPVGTMITGIWTNYSTSIHKAGAAYGSNCAGCHGGTAASATHPANSTYSAINLSTFIAPAAIQGGDGNTVAANGLFCASCHNGAHPIPHGTTVSSPALPVSLGTCASCHTGQNGNGTGDAHSIQAYTSTSMTEATCKTCHGTPTGTMPASDATIVTNYAASVHAQGEAFSSSCAGCHGGSAASATHPANGTYSAINATTFIASVAVNAGGEGITAVPAGTVFCAGCHKGAYGPAHVTVALKSGVTCSGCHTDPNGQGNGTGDAHAIQPLPGCVTCHAVGQAQVNATLVDDNNGVRAITGAAGEFELSGKVNGMGYRSHHIYNGAGVDPQDAQCIACHLEGKASNRAVSVDSTYHMADGFVHLRSGNTAISANFAWDPANPNHTGMDNFCMSCHNASGAVSAYANISTALYGMTAIPGAQPLSPLNPFGDKLTNAYDQKVRPGVVNVYDQMNPANPSHHAVRGAKYSGRTRNAADPNGRVVANAAVFTQYSGAGNQTDIHLGNNGNPYSVTAHSSTTYYNQPGQPSTFVQFAYQVFGTYSTSGGLPSGNAPGNYPGSRQTIYDAGFFVATYTTLDGATLGDDSTLHCGDCHSVGQWKAGSAKAITWNNSSTASGGSTIISTTAVIGAHGSQNEYMLRTSNGSDSLQKQSSTGAQNTNPAGVVGRTYTNGTYVCFLCHRQEYYGDNGNVNNLTLGTGALRGDGGHGGSIGPCNGNAYSGYGQKGTARYGVLVNGKASPAIGNLFAMSCAHCHNSGQQNFGGIHGATGTYLSYSTNGVDVIGNAAADAQGSQAGAYLLNVTHKPSYRFMGGESIRYNGGATADKWEVQVPSTFHREGCYNLSQTSDKTHLWNTTNPATTAAGGTYAIQNNGNGDSAWGVTDYTSSLTGRYGQNNTASGWGSCNHHQGSTTSGPTAPTRAIQRPLVY
jgi:ribosomal protein L37AE/L43A